MDQDVAHLDPPAWLEDAVDLPEDRLLIGAKIDHPVAITTSARRRDWVLGETFEDGDVGQSRMPRRLPPSSTASPPSCRRQRPCRRRPASQHEGIEARATTKVDDGLARWRSPKRNGFPSRRRIHRAGRRASHDPREDSRASAPAERRYGSGTPFRGSWRHHGTSPRCAHRSSYRSTAATRIRVFIRGVPFWNGWSERSISSGSTWRLSPARLPSPRRTGATRVPDRQLGPSPRRPLPPPAKPLRV